jgi:hypothetical protein
MTSAILRHPDLVELWTAFRDTEHVSVRGKVYAQTRNGHSARMAVTVALRLRELWEAEPGRLVSMADLTADRNLADPENAKRIGAAVQRLERLGQVAFRLEFGAEWVIKVRPGPKWLETARKPGAEPREAIGALG